MSNEAAYRVMGVVARVAHVMNWIIFATFHLAILALFLLVAWWFQIAPQSVQKAWDAAFQEIHGPKLLSAFGLLGLSVAVLATAYARAWLWILRQKLEPYLLAAVDPK